FIAGGRGRHQCCVLAVLPLPRRGYRGGAYAGGDHAGVDGNLLPVQLPALARAVVDEWLVTRYCTGADCQCGGVADAVGVYHGTLVAAVVSYAAVDGRAVAGCGVCRIAGDGGGGNREAGCACCCRSGPCPRISSRARP